MKTITAVLEEHEQIDFALLFGSRAEGRARADSDWDVGIFVSEELDKTARFRLQREIIAALAPSIDVNLVVLNDVPPLLAFQALKGKKLIERSKPSWVRFFVRTMSRYLDQKYWLDFFAENRRSRRKDSRVG